MMKLRRLRHLARSASACLALLACWLGIGIGAATADTTVRMQTSLGNIDIQLMDTAAPATVANFLAYVNSGAWVNSFIHRSVPGFVIQGGGFRFSDTTGTSSVPANAPVVNEFSATRSNVRGTIAMAKLGTDPNSATNQWFFNLADNSANLNNQNGGFTVFGQVIGNGMQVVDAIAALTVVNAGTSFTNLPLITLPASGSSIKTQNLVMVSAVTILDTQAPTVPGNLNITASGASQVQIAWSAATDNTAVTSYKLYRNGTLIATLGSVTSYLDTLSSGTSQAYTVQACDAAGNCSAQSASAALQLLPGAPVAVTALAGNASATVSFAPPQNNGGSTITSYTVTASPGSITATGTASPITVTGLSNGTDYSFVVRATNATGNSVASASSNVVTPGASSCLCNMTLAGGYNLLGNALGTAIDVVATFGNQNQPVAGITPFVHSVWKWDPAAQRWLFHSPAMTATASANYAASRSMGVLTSIAPGEGYWVNALSGFTMPTRTGSAFNWNSTQYASLPSGYNLVAHGTRMSPGQFTTSLSATPPSTGSVPTTVLNTLWTWDADAQKWFFYSPVIEAANGPSGVRDYALRYGFSHFADTNRMIEPGMGMWVQKP